MEPDHADVELGMALLSRWPLLQRDVITMPARHRAWDPVILKASVAHPAGPLPILVACLEYATTYSDDRLAQASLLADLATDPATDGPCPSLAMGDLNAAADSAVLRPLREVLIDAWPAGGGAPDAVTLPSTHPSAPLEAGPELVDQRIDHIFFRPGHEDQLVNVESVTPPVTPWTACTLRPPSGSRRPSLARPRSRRPEQPAGDLARRHLDEQGPYALRPRREAVDRPQLDKLARFGHRLGPAGHHHAPSGPKLRVEFVDPPLSTSA